MPFTLPFPSPNTLRISFVCDYLDLKTEFDRRGTGIESRQVSLLADTDEQMREADVLVTFDPMGDEELVHWPNLKYLQSVSAGTEQFDGDAFKFRNILLASGSGANANAVSEHAISLLLAVTHHLGDRFCNQQRRVWPERHANPADRASELTGQTMLVLGLGNIGNRICRLAKAFDMHVIGVRHSLAAGVGNADEVHPFSAVKHLISRADIIVVASALSEETHHIINREALTNAKSTAVLVNISRGSCVDEVALVDALQEKRLAGAGLDVTEIEPLPAESSLWKMENVIITPHIAGESYRYEINIIDILVKNLETLWEGSTALVNRVV